MQITFIPTAPQDIDGEIVHKTHNSFGILSGEITVNLKNETALENGRLADESRLGDLVFDSEIDTNDYFGEVHDSYSGVIVILGQTAQHIQVGANDRLYPDREYRFVYRISAAKEFPSGV